MVGVLLLMIIDNNDDYDGVGDDDYDGDGDANLIHQRWRGQGRCQDRGRARSQEVLLGFRLKRCWMLKEGVNLD